MLIYKQHSVLTSIHQPHTSFKLALSGRCTHFWCILNLLLRWRCWVYSQENKVKLLPVSWLCQRSKIIGKELSWDLSATQVHDGVRFTQRCATLDTMTETSPCSWTFFSTEICIVIEKIRAFSYWWTTIDTLSTKKVLPSMDHNSSVPVINKYINKVTLNKANRKYTWLSRGYTHHIPSSTFPK